jgi:signal transduction histidine kinase
MLLNPVTNAIGHTPDEGKVELSLAERRRGGHRRARHGIGIASNDLPHI